MFDTTPPAHVLPERPVGGSVLEALTQRGLVLLVVVLVLAIAARRVSGEGDPDAPRPITVTGNSEVKVVPDQVRLTPGGQTSIEAEVTANFAMEDEGRRPIPPWLAERSRIVRRNAMLYTRIYRVKQDRAERLRSWMEEVARRGDEARASYAQEGTSHVQAFLLEQASEPVLVFIAEVSDPAAARGAFSGSKLAIDLEHRDVMHEVVEGRAEAELIYEWAEGGAQRIAER